MAQITLITGGCRSGKSRLAQELAERLPGPRLFVATCPVTDEEMARRIGAHQKQRAGRGWTTLEEPFDLAGALKEPRGATTILVDCLTLWVGNLLCGTPPAEAAALDEAAMAEKALAVAQAARGRAGHVLFVTNEVGLGIVPDNELSRRFRDLAGRCNQIMAAHADTVVLMVCGIPMVLKGTLPVRTKETHA
jgi:adenosylcobinamide kinase / adenosylcobinamide-phosphate guanylyltransferase